MAMEKRRKMFVKRQQQRNAKRKTTNIILLSIALFMLIFIISMEIIFCVKGSVPDTLIQYTMGAGGVEAVLLAAIKISKVVVGERTDSDDRTD